MNSDTIKLLRECDAGVKMGISSLEEGIEHVKDENLKKLLENSKNAHKQLEMETEELLKQYNDDGKEPAAIAKIMSWVKTNVKLTVDNSDAVVADLITDGCGMGVKSLYKYLHQYPASDQKAKELAEKVIKEEADLIHAMHDYL